jgi:hypothetical protein
MHGIERLALDRTPSRYMADKIRRASYVSSLSRLWAVAILFSLAAILARSVVAKLPQMERPSN